MKAGIERDPYRSDTQETDDEGSDYESFSELSDNSIDESFVTQSSSDSESVSEFSDASGYSSDESFVTQHSYRSEDKPNLVFNGTAEPARKLKSALADYDGIDNLLSPFYPRTNQQDPWLLSTTIEDFLSSLCEKYKSKKASFVPFHYNQRLGEPLPIDEALKHSELIFVPFCERLGQSTKRVHYSLMVIIRQGIDFKIIMIDSLNVFHNYEKLVDEGKNLINRVFKDLYDKIVFDRKCITYRQDNAYDCGVALCYYAEQYCKGKGIVELTPGLAGTKSYAPYRLEIAVNILKRLQLLEKSLEENIEKTEFATPERARRPSVTYQYSNKKEFRTPEKKRRPSSDQTENQDEERSTKVQSQVKRSLFS